MKLEILEVKGLIEKLCSVDTEFRVFGADSHRYHIGPTLSETEILDFEKKHKITLPEDYRLYLQLVGNGSGRPPRPHPCDPKCLLDTEGAGPHYGLYPLSKTVIGDRVSQPFPFTEKGEIEYDPDNDLGPDVPGLLEISHQGCTGSTHLVVTGEAFSTVWNVESRDTFYPTHFTFIQWMRSWAEREIQVFANKPLVERIKVGMTKNEVISATGEGWVEGIFSGRTFFDNFLMRAQLELDENNVVTSVRSYF